MNQTQNQNELDIIRNRIEEILKKIGYEIEEEENFLGTYYYNTRDNIIIVIRPRITSGCESMEEEDSILEYFKKEIEEKVRDLKFKVDRIHEFLTESVIFLKRMN